MSRARRKQRWSNPVSAKKKADECANELAVHLTLDVDADFPVNGKVVFFCDGPSQAHSQAHRKLFGKRDAFEWPAEHCRRFPHHHHGERDAFERPAEHVGAFLTTIMENVMFSSGLQSIEMNFLSESGLLPSGLQNTTFGTMLALIPERAML